MAYRINSGGVQWNTEKITPGMSRAGRKDKMKN
jgi:hypothetical protein